MNLYVVCSLALLLAACAPKGSTPPAEPGPTADGGDASTQSITSAECESRGGTVIGDIGDGAIHQPGYVCPESETPPIASIAAEPGGPIAVEGSVCCA